MLFDRYKGEHLFTVTATELSFQRDLFIKFHKQFLTSDQRVMEVDVTDIAMWT